MAEYRFPSRFNRSIGSEKRKRRKAAAARNKTDGHANNPQGVFLCKPLQIRNCKMCGKKKQVGRKGQGNKGYIAVKLTATQTAKA